MSLSLFSFLGHPRADLSAFIDGQLSTERTAVVDAHVARCASCRAEIDGLLETRAALTNLPQAEAPRSFALTPQQVAKPVRPLRERPKPVAPAFFGMRIASAGLAVTLALVFVADLGDSGSNNNTARELGDSTLSQMTVADDGSGGDAAEGDIAPAAGDEDMKDESPTAVPGSGGGVGAGGPAPDETLSTQVAPGGPPSFESGTPAAEDSFAPTPTDTEMFARPGDAPSGTPVPGVADLEAGTDGAQYDSVDAPTAELANRLEIAAQTGDNDDGLSALQIAEIALAVTLAAAVVGGFLVPLALRRNG